MTLQRVAELLKRVGPPQQLQLCLVADRAYESDETRQLAPTWATHQ